MGSEQTIQMLFHGLLSNRGRSSSYCVPIGTIRYHAFHLQIRIWFQVGSSLIQNFFNEGYKLKTVCGSGLRGDLDAMKWTNRYNPQAPVSPDMDRVES
jgi:hypothetical protein